MLHAHTDATMGGPVHDDGVELIDLRSARRDAWRAWLKHWASPGVSTPWWGFIVRLGFWLLIGAGGQTASAGEGWHPARVAAALGIAEVGWRAFAKLRARRRIGFRANVS
jgi:hypothetical protein